MFVVERIEMIILVKKSPFKQHYEKFGTFSITNGYEKHWNSKIYIQFFTE